MAVAMSAFADFLVRLSAVLERRAEEGARLDITFNPTRRGPAAADEVYVGVGAWEEGATPVPHLGACLNNKGAGSRFGRRADPPTVASFVKDAPEETVAAWRARFPDAATALERARFVVEDASPDSVLSVILWLSRLEDVPPAQTPARWLTALTAWERDGVAPSVTHSWAALMSALSHSHFGSRWDGEGLAPAWEDALRFTVALLRDCADPDKIDPNEIPAILVDPGYGRALAFAMNERQDYLQSLARAVRLELIVPMSGAPGRTLLVDAYFATEAAAPSGVKKIFIRTDAENTTLGVGFSLMGLHRPGLEGTGNDMTVSVDPRSGVMLKDLWERLEALEIERWGGARPAGSPRRIASYPQGGFDQPWWDDHGRYTLLGAPKRLDEATRGSKLGWSDVLEATWRCYHPLNGVNVLDIEDPERAIKPIELCHGRRIQVGEGDAAVTKWLLAAQWRRGEGEAQALRFTETVRRQLAAIVAKAAGGSAPPVALVELPEASDYDFLDVPGGVIIATREGAFLFDDWRDRALPVAVLGDDFAKAAALLSACKGYERELDALTEKALARSGGLFHSPTTEILKRLTELRAAIAQAFQKASLADADPVRRAFRAALAERWGLAGKEEQLVGRLKDLQEIVETKATLDTQGMAQLIAFMAIPAFATAFMTLFNEPLWYEHTNPDESKDVAGFVAVMGIGAILLTIALLAIAVWATRRRD